MRLLSLLLCAALAQPLFTLRADDTPSAAKQIVAPETVPDDPTTNVVHLAPGANDARISYTVSQMLEKFHYLHLPFDADVSSKALDLYLNLYDPQHIHFLQSDLAEFQQYRTKLGELTKVKHDTSPAYIIFNRFMERLTQRTIYAKQLRHTEDFEFTGKEIFSLNRKTAPFPKDMEEAHQLWRDRVRFEYLEEKLNRESPTEMANFIAARHTPIALGLAGTDFRNEIVTLFDKRYARILRNFQEWDSEQVLESYLTAVARVYDPHSDYESRPTLEDFEIQMSLSLFGIGATLTTDDDGYCQIMSLQPGMPAHKTKKLSPNDRIVAVAQDTNEPVDVVSMPLKKVVRLIRGPKGTEVRLTIIPADATDHSTRKIVSVIRDEIKLEDQQAKGKLIEMPVKDGATQRLGVIELPSFYASFPLTGGRGGRGEIKSATKDVFRLMLKLKNEHADGLILDLRRNGGGLLPEAIELAGLFIKEGPIVQEASSDGSVQVDSDPDHEVRYDGPLVVLVDRFSASASEIVAGALQDYGRGVLVGGASTHGKGTVQSVSQLAPYLSINGQYFTDNPLSLGALKYTIKKFYRVTGSSTQIKGVVPDIILPTPYDYMETEEASEEYALKWNETNKTEFDKLNRVQPYLAALEKRSAARVAKSKDFDYVREDVDIEKKLMANKSVSLNERQRLSENEENEARRKTREAELKSRAPGEEKIYNLTLKDGVVEMVEQKSKPTFATNQLATVVVPKVKYIQISKDTNAISGGSSALVTPDDTTHDTLTPKEEAVTSPEEKAPLEEAEHILSDYINLLRAGSNLTADQAPKSAETSNR